MKYNSNPNCLENYTAVLFENQNGVTCLNMSGNFIQKLLRIVINVKINKRSRPESKNYDQEVFSTTLDSCKIEKGVLGSFVVKAIIEQMKDTNYKFECSLNPGLFYMNNFAPPRDDLLPIGIMAFHEPVSYFEFNYLVKAKLRTSKALVHVYTLKVEGELRKMSKMF